LVEGGDRVLIPALAHSAGGDKKKSVAEILAGDVGMSQRAFGVRKELLQTQSEADAAQGNVERGIAQSGVMSPEERFQSLPLILHPERLVPRVIFQLNITQSKRPLAVGFAQPSQ